MLVVADTSALLALALYKRLGADFLLLDDHRARKAASINGIRVVGSRGVFLEAKERGLLKEVGPILERLKETGIRYGQDLVEKVLLLAGES